MGRDFSTWIKDRIAAYGFVDGRDYVTEAAPGFTGAGNRGARIDYFLTLDMAKELAMVERTQRGKEARAYFIEPANDASRPLCVSGGPRWIGWQRLLGCLTG